MAKKITLTEFEWRVLHATLEIPLGETRSYRWIAEKIGRPGAVRAVGQALRKNPYPLIIPCHRVVRNDGVPGGYAEVVDNPKKKQLLAKERTIVETLKKLAAVPPFEGKLGF